MLGETRGSHGLWVFHRAVPDALLGVDPHQSQSSCPTSLSSPKPDKNENKMINWMVEGQPPRGFSWTRRGVSDKCLGLMSTLQSSRRRCIKHRLSAGKAGERLAMKQEEQGPPACFKPSTASPKSSEQRPNSSEGLLRALAWPHPFIPCAEEENLTFPPRLIVWLHASEPFMLFPLAGEPPS